MVEHEPDIEGLIRESARAGGRDAKIRYLDRRLLLIYVFVVVLVVSAAWYGRFETNRLQHRIEQRSCLLLVPLLPKSPSEVPTSSYGLRILTGVKQGAAQNHCARKP
jgi:hypothetical protein